VRVALLLLLLVYLRGVGFVLLLLFDSQRNWRNRQQVGLELVKHTIVVSGTSCVLAASIDSKANFDRQRRPPVPDVRGVSPARYGDVGSYTVVRCRCSPVSYCSLLLNQKAFSRITCCKSAEFCSIGGEDNAVRARFGT
jgi:hypothetical protein